MVMTDGKKIQLRMIRNISIFAETFENY
jgi:hypothetical protein